MTFARKESGMANVPHHYGVLRELLRLDHGEMAAIKLVLDGAGKWATHHCANTAPIAENMKRSSWGACVHPASCILQLLGYIPGRT